MNQRPGDSIRRAAGHGLHAGLMKDAEKVLESAREKAPIGGPDDPHRGQLRASGHIQQEKHAILVVFDVPWASDQHERFEYSHEHGGQAKYLENAVKELAGELLESVAHEVKTYIERTRTI
jgi:hypothetical protein